MYFFSIFISLIILNAIVIMAMLLNIRPSRLSIHRRICFFIGAAAILLLQVSASFWVDVRTYAKFYLLFAQLPTLILFCLLSKQGIIKPFFVMLTTIFLSSPSMTVLKICNVFLPLHPIMMLILILLVDLAMLYFIWKHMKPNFDYILNVFDFRYMLGFCSVPLLYNLMILSTGGYLLDGPNLLFRILICLITLAAFFLMMSVFRRAKDISDLQIEKSMMEVQLSMAKQKMEELYRTTEQAKIYRHDMHHHLSYIAGLAIQGDLDNIKDYLSRTEQTLNEITPHRFSENETVNLVLSYFKEEARNKDITLSIKAILPRKLNIPDTELCSVLSNGLDNALRSVAMVPDKTLHKVYMDCHMEGNMLLIEIENAYTGALTLDHGIPISHRAGHGYGCRSMKSIAEKRNGICIFRAKDEIFTLRLALPVE